MDEAAPSEAYMLPDGQENTLAAIAALPDENKLNLFR
jgi:hypothetical protein